ncbi:MAG: preprotein translocase subunit YajC [Acidobacteriota bacterium]
MTIDSLTSIVAQAAGGSTGLLVALVPYLLVFFIFYLIWWRPVRQRQKALEEQIANLKKGDRVVTNGGLYGKVVKVDDAIVVLEIADNVRARFAKSAIGGLEGTPTESGRQ